jgi:glutaredoxin
MMRRRPFASAFAAWLALAIPAIAGCQGDDPLAHLPAEGEPIQPPFAVRGEAEGLLLVYFDHEGLHTVSRRSEIPAEHRAMVRVDDLSAAPEDRLDPELVYVADLRQPGADGHYPVRRMTRAAFEGRVNGAAPAVAAANPPAAAPEAGEPTTADVIVYGASWCGACRSVEAFLRARQIPFVERDIEREPGAREAMLRAARSAGIQPGGIPVIDFRGRIIQGFDQPALERAIQETRAPI